MYIICLEKDLYGMEDSGLLIHQEGDNYEVKALFETESYEEAKNKFAEYKKDFDNKYNEFELFYDNIDIHFNRLILFTRNGMIIKGVCYENID